MSLLFLLIGSRASISMLSELIFGAVAAVVVYGKLIAKLGITSGPPKSFDWSSDGLLNYYCWEDCGRLVRGDGYLLCSDDVLPTPMLSSVMLCRE